MADHLSHIRYDEGNDSLPKDDSFLDDNLYAVVEQHPWYADFANYLVGGTLPPDLSYQQKKKIPL